MVPGPAGVQQLQSDGVRITEGGRDPHWVLETLLSVPPLAQDRKLELGLAGVNR